MMGVEVVYRRVGASVCRAHCSAFYKNSLPISGFPIPNFLPRFNRCLSMPCEMWLFALQNFAGFLDLAVLIVMASLVFPVELLVVDVLEFDFSNFCLYDQQIYLHILSPLYWLPIANASSHCTSILCTCKNLCITST